MNTLDVKNIITSEIVVCCADVYPAVVRDQLPTHINQTKTTAFIVNTDPIYLEGEHWVGLYNNGCGKI